ncbi:hypothetical protein [Helcococcus kunzii]|uniref:hypothetical protein n=2 Tax=Helcococcus kunzii TaxID=40091 RepID=UPI00389DB38A
MKKSYVIILFLLSILVGCAKPSRKPNHSRYITLQFDVSEVKDVASIDYTIRTKDVTQKTGFAVEKNDKIVEDYVTDEFLDLSGKKDFSIEFTISDKQYHPTNENERKDYNIKEKININPKNGQTYKFKLTGDYDNGFKMMKE